MCLAVPGRVLEITGEDSFSRTARVDYGGVVQRACLAYVPEAVVGDFVLVHAGFALTVLDEEDARRTLEDFRTLGELQGGTEG